MRKHFLPVYLLTLCCALFLTGCLKDRLTKLLSGTYIVNGTQTIAHYNGQTDTIQVTNASIVVSKQDKETLTAVYNVTDASTLSMEYDEDVSSVYFYRGFSGNLPDVHYADLAFMQNDRDSVYTHYTHQTDSSVIDYILTGRKL
jgi:ABC-type Fe3+-hydroxamate transport system substrate-binding protein